MRTITSMEELKSLVGQKVAVTDWFAITQERINLFADATDDHQWIHQDAGRCREESPYGTTVAHGFLTLSLLPAMLASAITMPAARVTLNYGGNKARFPAPVPVGSRLRGRMALLEVEEIGDSIQVLWKVTIEREGTEKPVCVAELILRRYG